MNFASKDVTKYIYVYIALFIAHTMALYVPILGVSFGVIEYFVLLSLVVKNNIKGFLLALCFILPTTYEFPLFVFGQTNTEIYSCLSLPIVEGYPFLLLLFYPLLFNSRVFIKNYFDLCDYTNLRRLKKFMKLYILIGFAMGFFSVFINDNNIRNLDIVKIFFRDAVAICSPICIALYFVYAVVAYRDLPEILHEILYAFMVALNITALLFSIAGLFGSYGESVVLMPTSYIFSMMILFVITPDIGKKHIILAIISMLISIYMQLRYSNALGGKSWIVLFAIGTYWLSYMFRKKALLTSITAIIMIVVAGASFTDKFELAKEDNTKLTQATMLMTTFSAEAYEILPFSPKVRIEEFVDVCKEIIDKPYYLLGKGFGGSIKDYSQSFGYYNDGAFHRDEYSNNSFIFLHESVNVLFLKFGLFGLFLIFYIVKVSIKNCIEIPQIMIGLLWTILFFNYSMSIALIGIPALILGLYNIDEKNIMQRKGVSKNYVL